MDTRAMLLSIFELHKRRSLPPIQQSIWHEKIDDQWEFWVNGFIEKQPINGGGVEIAGGDCYVTFNGWPAALFSLITGEGAICAGSAANMDTFTRAVQNA
jgi:hypothetical protein